MSAACAAEIADVVSGSLCLHGHKRRQHWNKCNFVLARKVSTLCDCLLSLMQVHNYLTIYILLWLTFFPHILFHTESVTGIKYLVLT